MGLFPTVEWFQRLAGRMEATPEQYRRLGPAELVLVVQIALPQRAERIRLAFAGYGCRAGRVIEGAGGPGDADAIVLAGDYATWKEMIENIRLHGHADLQHTLNALLVGNHLTLAAACPGGQLAVDRFYRYLGTLQAFFDGAAEVPTELAIVLPLGGIPLRQLEREAIVNTLGMTNGNQSEAARLLGLRESTLRYRLRKLGITPMGRHGRSRNRGPG